MKRYFVYLFFIMFAMQSCAQKDIVQQPPTQTDSTIYNRIWVLTRLNNKKINYKEGDTKITLVVTSENEYASGSSGCNTYVGQVVIKRNHIMFRDIGTTLMLCPDKNEALERTYLNNLNEIDSWSIIDEDLYLYKNDRPILIYTKE
ncbi:MAG: META domain-containing protein [Bacteroidales bacterium]|nr:META domain-containing protein [Bacteroidales bacterium]